MTTAVEVEAALAKLRSARFQLYVYGQQRNEIVLRQARYTETVESINQKIAGARDDVTEATDELLLALAEEEPSEV